MSEDDRLANSGGAQRTASDGWWGRSQERGGIGQPAGDAWGLRLGAGEGKGGEGRDDGRWERRGNRVHGEAVVVLVVGGRRGRE